MSPERAKEIWQTRSPFGELAVTLAEREFVRGIWKQMPGHFCFVDALLAIANGQVSGGAV